VTSAESSPRPPFRLEPLSPRHDVSGFTCGDSPEARAIDTFLREHARAEHEAGLSSVTVAVDAATDEVVGFFTLSPLSIPVSPQVLTALGLDAIQYRAVGGFLLGRLGVAVARQGVGLGAALVVKAVEQATNARREGVGGAFVAVDPKDERLAAWYASLGFTRLDPDRRRVVRRIG
jgi:predicted N-acetyltransferase YhbS